jgi:hypothetical protein
MRKGILASAAALLCTAGTLYAQSTELSPSLGAPPVPLGACAEPGCDPGPGVCGPPGRAWVSVDYLLWWIKNDHLPPLVTVSPPGSSGVLPGAEVAIGGSDLESDSYSGTRVDLGFWLNDCHTLGLETDFFFLGRNSRDETVGALLPSSGTEVARPFFNVAINAPDAELVAAAGAVSGTVTASQYTRLWGIGENALANLYCGCAHRVDLVGGFRYLSLNEGLTISEALTVAPGVAGAGSAINLADEFGTHNRFYGGTIGVRAEYWWGRFFVNGRASVALGDTDETVRINGTTTFTPPGGATVVQSGGLLAQASNIGRFSRDEFSVVPEVGFNVGYQVTPRVRAYVGYTYLYWSDVVRPSGQIDLAVNPTQVPSIVGPGTLMGPARPAVPFRTSDFWAQGINFGVEFRF